MTYDFTNPGPFISGEPITLEATEPAFRTSAFSGLKAHEIPQANGGLGLAPAPVEREEVLESERIFCSTLVQSKIKGTSREVLEARLNDLMKSPELVAILQAARNLSQDLGTSEAEAMQGILNSLREVDEIWDQLLLSEGLDALNRA